MLDSFHQPRDAEIQRMIVCQVNHLKPAAAKMSQVQRGRAQHILLSRRSSVSDQAGLKVAEAEICVSQFPLDRLEGILCRLQIAQASIATENKLYFIWHIRNQASSQR